MSIVTARLMKCGSLSTNTETHACYQGRKRNKVQPTSSGNPKDASDEERGLDPVHPVRTEHIRSESEAPKHDLR